MSAFVYRKAEQTTTVWSGGTTTQLCILPSSASYSERNFLCRISTASIEVEETRFTELPGFSRLLMVLEGRLTITHMNRYSVELRTGDTDSFNGGWETSGIGKVRDFNLMLAKGCTGSLALKRMKQQQALEAIGNDQPLLGCYLATGHVSANDGTKEFTLEAGDWIGFEQPHELNRLLFHARADSALVLVHVKFPA